MLSRHGRETTEDPEHALSCAMETCMLRLRAIFSPRFPVNASYVPVIASGRNSMYIHYTDHSTFGKTNPSSWSPSSSSSSSFAPPVRKEAIEKGEVASQMGLPPLAPPRRRRRRSASPRMSRAKQGKLIRMDAGVSLEHVPTDCTRTFPLGPSRSSPSSSFPVAPYETLLRLQRRLLQRLHLGMSLQEMDRLHLQGSQTCLQELFSSSIDGHLVPSSPRRRLPFVSDAPIPTPTPPPIALSLDDVRTIFCPHRFGHPFGLDIHEAHPPLSSSFSSPSPDVVSSALPRAPQKHPVGTTHPQREGRKISIVPPLPGKALEAFAPGMIYTVEPGFYFPDAAHAALFRRSTATPSPSVCGASPPETTPSASASSSWIASGHHCIPSPWQGLGVQVEDEVLLLPPAAVSGAPHDNASPRHRVHAAPHTLHDAHRPCRAAGERHGCVWSRAAYLAAAIDALQEQDAIVDAVSSGPSAGRPSHSSHPPPFSSSSFSSLSFRVFSKVAQKMVPIQIKGGGLLRHIPDYTFLQEREARRTDIPPSPLPPPSANRPCDGIPPAHDVPSPPFIGAPATRTSHRTAFLWRSRLPLMRAMFRLVYTQRVSIEGVEEAERHWREDVRRIQNVCGMEEKTRGGGPHAIASHGARERVAPLTEHFTWFPTCCQWYPFDIVVLTACIPKDLDIIRFVGGTEKRGRIHRQPKIMKKKKKMRRIPVT